MWSNYDSSRYSAEVTLCVPFTTVRFGAGGGSAFFDISNDGLTAKRNARDGGKRRLICAVPNVNNGKSKTKFVSVDQRISKKKSSHTQHRRSLQPRHNATCLSKAEIFF